jgi:hypothetical protein
MGLRGKLGTAASLAAFGALVAVTPAQALTLGSTGFTGATNTGACNSMGLVAVAQTGTDAAFDYAVPSGGGEITSWSFATLGATASSPYGFLVVRPSGAGYTIVGGDNETVPTSVPAIATFSLPTPILVQAGDLLGAVLEPTDTVPCLLQGGTTSAADVYSGGTTTGATGSAVGLGQLGNLGVINVSANLVQSEDVAIAQRAVPASVTAGGDGVFVVNATDAGPGSGPVTVTDTVPAGLSIISAVAGSGTCTVSGQTVSCSVPSAPGTLAIVVSATAAGTYANVATATGTLTDPNPANNSSSSSLAVTAPLVQNPAPKCHTASLTGTPLKVAKAVVGTLGCKVGKLTTKASKSVPKGDVISTSPGAGKTLALGTKVAIVSSSGKPKKKKKKH